MTVLRSLFRFFTKHLKTRDKTVTAGVARRVKTLLGENHPVVQFVRMCISSGVDKTQCYDDAVIAETSVRKQVQLALYDYLKSEEAPPAEMIYCYRDMVEGDYRNYYGVNLYFVETAERDFFETVQDHFADQLETYMGLSYVKGPLSTCDASEMSVSDPAEYDFVFEVKSLKRKHFQYWGHWHNNAWKPATHVFPQFDLLTLDQILRRR